MYLVVARKKKRLNEAHRFLKEHVYHEALNYFGLSDPLWLDQVVQNWFDEDREQNLRWPVIHSRLPRVGRVLDMAAGCGTFLLCGLKHGQDVWGVEPEGWKRKYFRLKIEGGGYPARFLEHLLPGVGERPSFKDQSFDLVTTYQTLEHVQNVGRCLNEMLRVLRTGGVLTSEPQTTTVSFPSLTIEFSFCLG